MDSLQDAFGGARVPRLAVSVNDLIAWQVRATVVAAQVFRILRVMSAYSLRYHTIVVTWTVPKAKGFRYASGEIPLCTETKLISHLLPAII